MVTDTDVGTTYNDNRFASSARRLAEYFFYGSEVRLQKTLFPSFVLRILKNLPIKHGHFVYKRNIPYNSLPSLVLYFSLHLPGAPCHRIYTTPIYRFGLSALITTTKVSRENLMIKLGKVESTD